MREGMKILRRLLWLSLMMLLFSTPGRCDTFEQIAHFGGNCQAVAAQGNTVYFSEGFDLNVFDISDPAHPVGINRISLFVTIQDIKVIGNLIYVADNSAGLVIVDASDPAKLKIVGHYDTPGLAKDVVVNGDLAYIADGTSGLSIVNIKNPASITKVGEIGTLGNTQGVAYDNGLIYAAEGAGGVQIIDVSQPSAPRRRGGYGAANALKIAGSGKIAYAVDSGFGLRVLDISNPDAVKQLATYAAPKCNNITLGSDKVYLSCDSTGFLILNVINPGKPGLVGSYDTPNTALDISLTGNIACVADSSSLQLIDVQTPQSPVKRGVRELLTHQPDDIAISGKRGYTIDNYGGLHTLDLGNTLFPNPIAPYLVLGNGNSFSQRKIAIFNNVAAVALGEHFYLVDLGNPAQPKAAYSWSTDGDFTMQNNIFIRVEGILIFIYDITNPMSPRYLGGHNAPSTVSSIAVKGNNAFAVTIDKAIPNQGALLTLDISDPSAILRRSLWGGAIESVAADDHFVYTLGWGGVLSILDPKDPTNLGLVSQILTRSTYNQTRMKIVDGLVYIYGGYNKFDVIDIRNPARPQDLWLSSMSRIYGLDVAGNRVYATGDYGVYIYQRKRDGLGVSNFSRDYYLYDYLKSGNQLYSDQFGTFTGTLPQWLDDRLYIQTRSIDKDLTRSDLVSFTLNQTADIVVALDERITSPPSWLAGWAKLGAKLTTDDPASPGRVLYRKRFEPGTVTLGPNRDPAMPTGRSMYSVIVAPPVSAAAEWGQYQ